MATIHECVELEVQLIDDLLDLTKIAREKLQLHHQPVNAHDLLTRTMHIVNHEIFNKKLATQIDARAECCILMADPARIQQVLWNILKNAIKFTPEGGAIYIRTTNILKQDHTNTSDNDCALPDLEISITDTGIGIEAQSIPHLFHAFNQGSPAITVQYGGLGLGLAISKYVHLTLIAC